MNGSRRATGLGLLCVIVAGAAGCAHRAPSIAHVHLGHSITGAHDTPDNVGYLTLAEQRARDALEMAEAALADGRPVDAVKVDVAAVNAFTNTEEPYSLTTAVKEAVSHIEYAALSDDASDNVKAGYQQFAETIDGALTRGSLIESYAREVASASDPAQVQRLAEEIHRLARANVYGVDADGDGVIGSSPEEYGMVQISADLAELIDREDPPYVTVDRWYLFNLIRLPSGDWIFRRGGSQGSGGYN